MDIGQDLYFDVYVNGQLIGIPEQGGFRLAPGEAMALDLPPISLSARNAQDLQVILVDSLGGSGWVVFDRTQGFGEGNRTVMTHRTEFRPPMQLPGVEGLPGSTKPLPVDIQEFELAFSVDYVPPPTVLERLR